MPAIDPPELVYQLFGPLLGCEPALDLAVLFALMRLAPADGVGLERFERLGQSSDLIAPRHVRNVAGRIPLGQAQYDGPKAVQCARKRPAVKITEPGRESGCHKQRQQDSATDPRHDHLKSDRHDHGGNGRHSEKERQLLSEIHWTLNWQ
ncbi:MAG: hypothetical protein A49_18430 [Methyloceanibacter sp.]|nr:MAG: hypothetical protein A49_18430 [Methyloceanibacter sp.]